MGRKRMYAKWDVAAKEIEDVLRNELKVEGLRYVRVVVDFCGWYNNISIGIDEGEKRVKWNENVKGDSEGMYSYDFEEKLCDYLNKKDSSILSLRGGGEKRLIVQKVRN